ncbi:hypothetical protein KEM55_003995, partial [Ascosphaera atra]
MCPTSTFEKSVIYVQSGLGLENFLRFAGLGKTVVHSGVPAFFEYVHQTVKLA